MRSFALLAALPLLLLAGCDQLPLPQPGAAPQGGTAATPFGQAALAEQQQQSMQRLRDIGRALHNHHDQMGHFPPAYVADATGKPLYSWRVLLLPYLGQQALYDRFDKTKAWDAPENLAISNTAVDAFKSPADTGVGANGVSYVAIVGEGCVFSGIKPRKFGEMLDGTSNTIAVIECRGIAGSWAAPVDLKQEGLRLELGDAADQIRSPYPHGLLHLRCDGSVGTVATNQVSEVLPKMLTIAGGEILEY
jgi:hypothetical protein